MGEFLGHLRPINKTAALVVSRGEEYVPKKKIQTVESRVFLETRMLRKAEINQESFVDLTGVKYARFTVVGPYRHGRGWVVRCVCGTYCVRKAKSIKNIQNGQDRCEECRHVAFLKGCKR